MVVRSSQNPALSPITFSRRVCLCLGLGLLLLVTGGCFEQKYVERMQVTIKFYAHMDDLNRNLGGVWSGGGFQFRAPLGFEFVPLPPPPVPDPNEPPPPANAAAPEDPRHPEFLGVTLPGLTGVWEKMVSVDDPNGPTTRKAYIYLHSNVSLFSVPPDRPGRIDPLKFNDHVINLLANDLGIQFKQEDWRREEFPSGFNLVPKVVCDSLVLLPERPIEETKMAFKVYITSQKDTQAMMIFVYPDAISATEKLADRIIKSLETLRIPADASQALIPASGSGGGAGPAL